MLQEAKVRAKAKGIPFGISESDIPIPLACPVLGISLIVGGVTRSDFSPSIDRVDQTKGYVSGNVRVISWRANRLKNDASVDELRRLVAYCESALAVGLTAGVAN
jgi:hypothetical protein